MPKRGDESLPTNLVIRVAKDDMERLDALAATMPMLGKATVARACLRRGLEAAEAALAERDETKRLAALARVLGIGGGGAAPSRPRG